MIASTMAHTLTPRVGLLLTQVTETPDYERALWKLLFDYLDLKIQALSTECQVFEQKWDMTFAEFQQRMALNTLNEDAYSFEVEQAFWQWEKAETLRQYYEGLRAQWM
jgi:hypothetical protein